jgi:hypothetical protein
MLPGGSVFGWVQRALGTKGRLRFVIQPVVAIVLGVRDGRRDALADRAPYLWALVFDKGRRARLEAAVRAIAVPFAVAVLMDSLVQFFLTRSVRLRWSIAVGVLLIFLPYCCARALGNRAFRALHEHRHVGGQPHSP